MPSTKKTAAKQSTPEVGNKGRLPENIQPMLATLVDKPFDEPGWIYEVKWDGYRALSYLNAGGVEIRSRNNKSFNEKFYPIYNALKEWKVNAIVDGEILVLNDKGAADFADLQNWRSEADGHLVYYVFDILWLDRTNLMNTPLEERRKILKSIMPKNSLIKMSETFDATGTEFFSLIDKMGLEGIIAKKAASKYVPGQRSKEWLKIKTEKRQEFVIGGYTLNENTSKLFSALLVGVYTDGVLDFVTPVGTGFSVKTQKELLEKMNALKTDKCPFSAVPDYNKPSRFRPNPPKASVTWIKPQLIAEVSYREETKDGAIRHPSFKGLREDKNAKEVVREVSAKTDDVIETKTLQSKKMIAAPGAKERKTLLNPKEESQVRIIKGHELKFSNLSKIYWPKENVTKRDMLNYYYQVAPFILPYMKDRPQTLNRFPHGIEGESFYQKNVKDKAPEWIKTFPYHSFTDGRDKEFLVCTDEASLLYTAGLGCIEMNPWSSRIQKPDNPDWCIIDLDPDKNPFEQVIQTAVVTRSVLESIGITSYCKTSGSTGLHIYIPLGAKYDYEDSKELGRAIAKIVHRELPKFTSIERKTADRKGKIYVDFLQNRPQATVAGPYSLRPKPGAPVSMPLDWSEVKIGLKILDFTIFNAIDRLKETGDLFEGVLGKGINIEKARKQLLSTFG
jgi:bifunctional non-homologous end joining protein LigD